MGERGTISAGDEQGLVVLGLGELHLVRVHQRACRAPVGRREEARRGRLPRRHA